MKESINSVKVECVEYFLIKGVQNMTDYGFLQHQASEGLWKTSQIESINMWNNTEEYLKTPSEGILIKFS